MKIEVDIHLHGDAATERTLTAILNTLQVLKHQGDSIMTAISDYAAKQNAFNTRQGAAIDQIVSSIDGVKGDIKGLNDLIEKLQTTPGPISTEDQATLDALEAAGDTAAAKVEAAATALAALDAQTPPVPPTA